MNLKRPAKLKHMRVSLQNLILSRAHARGPGVLVNSIGKSGTHLCKAYLKHAGLTYVGHYQNFNYKALDARASQNSFYFVTAHTTKATEVEKKILLIRDPASIAFSAVIYVKKRLDHRKSWYFRRLSLEDAFWAHVDGRNGEKTLATKFISYFDWAERTNAVILDFEDVRRRPCLLLQALNISGNLSDDAKHRAEASWNPTKRTRRLPREMAMKNQLRVQLETERPELMNVYQEMLKLRRR